jgi:hypothetical protein
LAYHWRGGADPIFNREQRLPALVNMRMKKKGMRSREIVRSDLDRDDDDVMASEVATYVFCAKAWHLERVLGATASAVAEEKRAAGSLAHETHGSRARRQQRMGRWLVLGTALLFAIALALLILVVVLSRS